MNFLLDAHLPLALVGILQAAEHDAVHASSLSAGNQTPDRVINELSLQQERVVATKDTDFHYSHVLQGRPVKLVLVRAGNIRVRGLKALFQRQLPQIITGAKHIGRA